uniref:Uncharacterized protein n=1 Tax=Astyanax mexicanus TaxID=7994 RepID=A0A3B1J3Z7_ASTMX
MLTRSFVCFCVCFTASVAAIVIGFILFVIIIFGGAYYFKMRRPSYGRLMDDTEYGSVGNILNPMFEDSG